MDISNETSEIVDDTIKVHFKPDLIREKTKLVFTAEFSMGELYEGFFHFCRYRCPGKVWIVFIVVCPILFYQ